MATTRILLVCMGNICRSPMAEGLIRHKARALGIDVETDSAGTINAHVGEAPDTRAQHCMRTHGIDINDLRARQVVPEDFGIFDLILAMDQDNRDNLIAMAPDPASAGRVELIMDLAPDHPSREVPDPWYGGADGFEDVYRMLDTASDNLMDRLSDER